MPRETRAALDPADWAVPGSIATTPDRPGAPGTPGAPGAPGTPGVPGVPGAPGRVSTPAIRPSIGPLRRLQPRGVGELLDGGFEVLRHRFTTILVLTAVFVIPLDAVPTLVNLGTAEQFTDAFGGSGGLFDLGAGLGAGSNGALTWLAALGGSLAIALVGLGVARLVTAWLMGDDPGLGQVLGDVARRGPTVLGAWLLALLCKVAGLLACGVGILVPVTLLMVVSPVVAAEPVGAAGAVARAWRLAGRRSGPMLVLVLTGAFVTVVVWTVLSLVAGLVLSLWAEASWIWIAVAAVDIGVELLLVPVQAAWAALAYVDLRVRTEGLDLELESTELLAATGRG